MPILGDAITATTHRVMAAVFDGDPQPLYEIILDRNAEEFVRSRMCEALAMPTWNCFRKDDPLSGTGGRAPSRCSG
jgi:L-asparaginase II